MQPIAKKKIKSLAGLTVVSVLCCTFAAVPVQASLIGTDLVIEETRNSLLNPLVVDSIEIGSVPDDGSIIWDTSLFDVSFSDGETIHIDFSGIGNPDFGLIFSGLDWGTMVGEIVGLSIVSSGLGITSVETAFTADSVSVYFGDLSDLDSTDLNSTLEITLDVYHPVPIPGAVVLFCSALSMVGLTWRRRQLE